jgi:hypothetical protein
MADGYVAKGGRPGTITFQDRAELMFYRFGDTVPSGIGTGIADGFQTAGKSGVALAERGIRQQERKEEWLDHGGQTGKYRAKVHCRQFYCVDVVAVAIQSALCKTGAAFARRRLDAPVVLAISMKRFLLITLLGTAVSVSFGGGPPARSSGTMPPFLDGRTPWADSVLQTLDLDHQIAQLMMVAAYSNKDAKHAAATEKMIREQGIGGLIFFQGGPVRGKASLTNRYQACRALHRC